MRYTDDISLGAPDVLDNNFIQHGIQADLIDGEWVIQYLVRREQ